MELRVARIEESVSVVRETLAKNTAILEVNTAILDDHIKRTEILEKQVGSIAVEARILRWAAAVAAIAAAAIELYKL